MYAERPSIGQIDNLEGLVTIEKEHQTEITVGRGTPLFSGDIIRQDRVERFKKDNLIGLRTDFAEIAQKRAQLKNTFQ